MRPSAPTRRADANGGRESNLVTEERLATHRPVAIRAGGGPSRSIGGYAAVFNRPSENLGGFVERVAPAFFNKSSGDNWPGVIARYNHDDAYLLGATRNGTLKLSIDATGLNYTVDLPECRNDVLEMVSRGDVGSSSFAFRVYEEDGNPSEFGLPLRTLISGRLIDVAPVPVPAYPDTTVAMRSLAEHLGVPFEDVRKLSTENELRKLFVRTDRITRRAMTGAEAKARLQAKAPKPLSGAVALVRTLGKKYPSYPPTAR